MSFFTENEWFHLYCLTMILIAAFYWYSPRVRNFRSFPVGDVVFLAVYSVGLIFEVWCCFSIMNNELRTGGKL